MLKEVQECVEAFNSSGVIPSKILQASLFRKPYYTNVFLRALLSPSLPSSVDPSRLIQALAKYICSLLLISVFALEKKFITFRQNKIPQKMLDTYARPRQGKLGKKVSHKYYSLSFQVCVHQLHWLRQRLTVSMRCFRGSWRLWAKGNSLRRANDCYQRYQLLYHHHLLIWMFLSQAGS